MVITDKGFSNSEDRFFENQGRAKLMTPRELAGYLGVSTKTVYGWVYRGLIEPIKVGPRLIRFEKQEVERWISQQ